LVVEAGEPANAVVGAVEAGLLATVVPGVDTGAAVATRLGVRGGGPGAVLEPDLETTTPAVIPSAMSATTTSEASAHNLLRLAARFLAR